jgi:hypothetical protein
LRRSAEKNGRNFPNTSSQMLDVLVASNPRRLEAVIAAKDASTKY